MAYSTATKETLSQLGAALRSLRQEAHYSQEKVAGMIGTTRRTVSNWENGKCEPSHSHLMLFARCFGVSLDYLTDGNGGYHS